MDPPRHRRYCLDGASKTLDCQGPFRSCPAKFGRVRQELRQLEESFATDFHRFPRISIQEQRSAESLKVRGKYLSNPGEPDESFDADWSRSALVGNPFLLRSGSALRTSWR